MTCNLNCLLIVLQIILHANSGHSLEFGLDTIKSIYSFKQNFNVSNIIDELSHVRLTENDDCSNDLSAISNGLENLEKWAIKIVDAWGTIPSGFFDGNRNSMGSFSECFNIERNGYEFKAQYCIAQIKLPSNIDSNKVKNSWTIFQDDATVSIGICVPASCSVDRLETDLNEAIQRKIDADTRLMIPKAFCQLKEKETQLQTFDLCIFGLVGIVLALIVVSTSYDIFYTLNNRVKHPPFVVFSIYSNGMLLFLHENKSHSDVLGCVRGIRMLSTLWIIYSHVFNMYLMLPLQNISSFSEFAETYRGNFFISSNVVDVFLTISGLLVAGKLFNLFKKNGKLNIISLYLDRYMRLTLLLCIYFLITMSLLRFLGSGPFWPMSGFFAGPCYSYWWSALLHIQNYVNPNEICFLTSWYLSVDMQLFIIAPAIVYLIHRSKKKTFVALFFLVLIGVGWILAVHAKHNLRNIMEPKFVELTYLPTHLRFIPWLVGFITGYLLSEFPKGSIRISKKLNYFGWILSIISLVASIFAGYPLFQSYPTHTSLMLGLNFAISRITLSTALCYIIFACVHDAGGAVNWFLSHPNWELFIKLSYAIYFTNYPILIITQFSVKEPIYFSEISAFQLYIGLCVLCFLASIVATLAIEIPIHNVFQSIANSRKTSNKIK